MITNIEDYFTIGCGRCDRFATPDCSVQRWSTGINHLRRLALTAGLTETLKWGHPCYRQAGRNIAIIGAFRTDFRLTFFNAALMSDPEHLLEEQGPNTRHADMIRFTEPAQVATFERAILTYLAQSMRHADAGRTAPKDTRSLDLPVELIAALATDPTLADAFHALTPGRQKSYVLNLTGTKNPATRIARITKFRPQILAGKGALDR